MINELVPTFLQLTMANAVADNTSALCKDQASRLGFDISPDAVNMFQQIVQSYLGMFN